MCFAYLSIFAVKSFVSVRELLGQPTPPVPTVDLVRRKMQRLISLVYPDVGMLAAMIDRDLNNDPAAT